MKKQAVSGALSCLRIFATVAVVISHAWSTLTDNLDMFSVTPSESIFLTTAYSLTKWAVPVFFMITGALFLRRDKQISIRDCIVKYAKRMLLALVIFGIPYGVLMSLFETKRVSFFLLPDALIRVLNGESFGHLWYLYTLIGIYLFLPVIKAFTDRATKGQLGYLLLILFVFNFCFPMVDTLAGTHIAFKLPLTTYPLFYLLLGHYFYNEKPQWTQAAWIPVAGTAVSVTVVLAVGIAGLPLGYVMDYSRPVCALFAASLFLLFNRIKKPASERVWALDRLCFGVYLIHTLFIQFVYKFLHITPIGTPLYPVLAVVFALVFTVLSFAASWVMAQIKPLKKYVL